MKTFKELLKLGQEYEDKCKALICKLNNVSIIEEQTKNNYKYMHYDFKTSDNITYEIKADFMSEKTNNFFIEYEGYNKPSGILITEAYFHILINGNNFYKIDTSIIKDMIKKGKYRAVLSNTFTKGFLIPINDIIKCSLNINK